MCQRGKKNLSFSTLVEKRTHRRTSVERTQALISDDPGQSLRKLASIVDVSESTMPRRTFDINRTH